MAYVDNAIRGVVIIDCGRLAVAAKCLTEGDRRRGSAEPRVAVQVNRAQPGHCDDGERIVILDKELPGVVDSARAARVFVAHIAATCDDHLHRLVPRCFPELSLTFFSISN